MHETTKTFIDLNGMLDPELTGNFQSRTEMDESWRHLARLGILSKKIRESIHQEQPQEKQNLDKLIENLSINLTKTALITWKNSRIARAEALQAQKEPD